MLARSRLLKAMLLGVPTALLAGCPAQDRPAPNYPPPQYGNPPPQGQWTPGGQWAPPGAPGPQMAPPVQPGPGQWTPPPPQNASPFPFWPPGVPAPNLGSLPIPGMPAVVPAMPGGPAQQCVDSINQYRASQRLPPLTRWFPAEPCATGQAQSDSQSNTPHGSFGRCQEMAQNVCPGWRGPAEQMIGPCLQSMWNEGPGADYAAHGHYLNMSNPRFTKVACGFYSTPGGEVWAIQDFQ
jgi:hypothetical protein